VTTAFDLLARGYFPKELTPPFNTVDFANRVVGHVGPIPSHFTKSRRARLCTYNFSRIGRIRRPLGIPNPIPQYALTVLVAKQWKRIERLINRSSISFSKPVVAVDRALVPGDTPLSEGRARLRATARHLVSADISRFYHSIYTHTISWAIHGKDVAKEKRGKKGERYFGNQLDQRIADCQDGQTIGIPVGPDTSLVLAELVASAVDEELRKSIRKLKGMRFIDDYEFPCRTRREADELLEELQIALSEFQLALNPLKTVVSELPISVDELWKTPIRTAQLRSSHKEQATDLVALFDIAYSLSREYPDKTILSYTMGRLVETSICPENAELFQRLSLQCILAEPGSTAAVLERLAANHQQGMAVNGTELQEILNAQIIEHAPLNHASEVAWALWGALIFDLKIGKQAAKAVSLMRDSVVAITALHAQQRKIIHAALDTDLWQSYLTVDKLYGEQWLLCYEASVKGWLKSTKGTDYVGADANFKWLRDLDVQFYDIDKASSLGAPASKPTGWLLDLADIVHRRSELYGEPEEEAEGVNLDVPPDLDDLL
jgi:Reverse transcriptase (RNA-dependent DNA polymerase)